MKKEFSKSWLSSKQVRKQRKYRANAPLHTKHTFLSAQLSKTLRSKYGKRSLPLRTGDEVLIMRGSFAKKKGKVLSVDKTRTRITVEGMNRSKLDGTKVNVYFHPSNVQIQTLKTDDKLRLKRIETTKTKDSAKATAKPEAKAGNKETKKDAPKAS